MGMSSAKRRRPVRPPKDRDKLEEKQRAELILARYEKHYDLSVEQMTAISKWLTASLFAANAGGILTVLNNTEKISALLGSGISFVIGLIFAILGATANQEIYDRVSDNIGDLIFHWSEVAITGNDDASKRQPIEEKIEKIMKFRLVGAGLGWISGLCFLIGAIFVATSLKP